ncbi:hypothetical protein PIB30_067661, partial [Stylosanthes scabra]|nr:hypothetical protein [Stylosanthes scabra]
QGLGIESPLFSHNAKTQKRGTLAVLPSSNRSRQPPTTTVRPRWCRPLRVVVVLCRRHPRAVAEPRPATTVFSFSPSVLFPLNRLHCRRVAAVPSPLLTGLQALQMLSRSISITHEEDIC